MTFLRFSNVLTLSAMLALGAAIAPAQATPTSTETPLDTYVGSGTPAFAGPWGTVTLTQVGPDVEVMLQLASDVGFVNSGAGEALLFNLDGISTISITGLPASFSLLSTNAGTIHTGGGGDFDFGIHCDACGNGGNGPITAPISFIVADVTLDKFIKNSSGNQFASDICIDINNAGRCGGITGVAVGETSTTKAPEPLTLSLVAAGLIGIGMGRRRTAKGAAA